jgi:hypothetical protein
MNVQERPQVEPLADGTNPTEKEFAYRKPELLQVGKLRDVRYKSGRKGDHDHDYYYS